MSIFGCLLVSGPVLCLYHAFSQGSGLDVGLLLFFRSAQQEALMPRKPFVDPRTFFHFDIFARLRRPLPFSNASYDSSTSFHDPLWQGSSVFTPPCFHVHMETRLLAFDRSLYPPLLLASSCFLLRRPWTPVSIYLIFPHYSSPSKIFKSRKKMITLRFHYELGW